MFGMIKHKNKFHVSKGNNVSLSAMHKATSTFTKLSASKQSAWSAFDRKHSRKQFLKKNK